MRAGSQERRRKQRDDNTKKEEAARLFACHFYKHAEMTDPVNSEQHPCRYRGFLTIEDVMEHLSTYHGVDIRHLISPS